MTREQLPNRRQIEHFEIEAGNFSYTVGVGRYPGGRVGEIFIDAGKAGTDLRTTSHDLAVAVSKLLQLGETVEGLRHCFARTEDGSPAGIIATLLDDLALRNVVREAAE